MTEVLALFCGGPAIYAGGVPKPLQPVAGSTLIETYLSHGITRPAEEIKLLCDESHVPEFEAVVPGSSALNVSVVGSPDGSTTLERLKGLLATSSWSEVSVLHLAYPDVFHHGIVGAADPVVSDSRITVSVTALKSRFPRLVTDPYTRVVRGISNHHSSVPANPMHIFAGDLFARPSVLMDLVDDFLSSTTLAEPSLEYDFLAWSINQDLVDAAAIDGDWLQIDSRRDLERLERLLSEAERVSHRGHERR